MVTRCKLCKEFLNVPLDEWRPFGCQPIGMHTRQLEGTGYDNMLDFYMLTVSNTIREMAHLDLAIPINPIVKMCPEVVQATERRVTEDGGQRITEAGAPRVVEVSE